jgi:CDP-4-dehydro-6-deoxyglucose reductase, E3
LFIKTTFGKTFLQADGQTVLDAATKSGIFLPYSCKTGRCSTCKCKVISGQSAAIVDELGLTEDEKSQGYILSCARSATTDMLVEVEDLGGQSIPKVNTIPARISSLEKLAPDVLCVKFRFPPNTALTYLAGQYIDVIGPGGIRRSYSVANAPTVDGLLQLHIREVQRGVMSEYWFNQAKVNDLVRINGPFGSFFMRPLDGLNLVFLATGTGVAPVKAMLEQLSSFPPAAQPLSASLYWGGREPQDLYASPSEWYPKLRYTPVLSRATDAWKGAHGYVQKAFLDDGPDLSCTVVYACGSGVMIQNAKAALTQAGLPDKYFFSDAFVSSGT